MVTRHPAEAARTNIRTATHVEPVGDTTSANPTTKHAMPATSAAIRATRALRSALRGVSLMTLS